MSKNVTEICTFPLLLMFVKLVLLITFLVHFLNFFNGFEISMKFCVLCYLFDKKNKNDIVILVLFSTFEAKREKRGQK